MRSKTVMARYLDDPELTAETLVDGWLMTGDLGRVDAEGHLQLFGRKKNMIVTAEGKNIYPEDIENTFRGHSREGILRLCGELYLAAAHHDRGATRAGDSSRRGARDERCLQQEISRRNGQLFNYKRISGYIVWDQDFPRNAAMKIRRAVLAEQIGKHLDRSAWCPVSEAISQS